MSSKKNVESSPDKNESKNRGWPKGKRRYPKGIGAPKQPLSGYVHFLNERRENVRTENPEITFREGRLTTGVYSNAVYTTTNNFFLF